MWIVLAVSLIMSTICQKQLLTIAMHEYCAMPIPLDWIEDLSANTSFS